MSFYQSKVTEFTLRLSKALAEGLDAIEKRDRKAIANVRWEIARSLAVLALIETFMNEDEKRKQEVV